MLERFVGECGRRHFRFAQVQQNVSEPVRSDKLFLCRVGIGKLKHGVRDGRVQDIAMRHRAESLSGFSLSQE